MSNRIFKVLMFVLVIGILTAIITNQDKLDNAGNAQSEKIEKQQSAKTVEVSPIPEKIYLGYYSREGNNAKMAETTGNNIYVKFYPNNRIIRLYIPYPYAKSVRPEAIKTAFDNAVKKSSGSAYIREKFGAMEQEVMAHLDTFRWVDNQVMFDCGKSEPCKVTFTDNAMSVLKPGMVVAHKINYSLVSIN